VAERDAELRKLYAEIATSSTSHVDEEAWARLAAGELDAAEQARVFEHATCCAECGSLYGDVTALRREAPRLGVPVAAPEGAAGARPAGRSWRAWRWRWLPTTGLAAAAAVIAALWLRPHLGPPSSPEARPSVARPSDASLTGELRSGPAAAPVPVSPRGRTDGVPRFRWRAAPDARAYRLELLSQRSEVVWVGEIDGTEAALPADRAPAPGRYRWHVGAIPSWSRSPVDIVWSPLVDIELAAAPR